MKLYYHPLSSYCWKVLIALYEAEVTFEPVLVDLSDLKARAELTALWPFAKFPVLEADETIFPESSIIIEYLAQNHLGARFLMPVEPELALAVRQSDRFFDLYVHDPMQKIVSNRIRPAGTADTFGEAAARATLTTAYKMIENQMSCRSCAIGDHFTLADCAAAPALFYANEVQELNSPNTISYLERLKARPSVARVLAEAEPYFAMFPR